jgi:YfiH family protein
VWQVHGADTVVWRDSPPAGEPLQQADGMVTDQIDLPLVMRFADCVPILFFDPHKKVIGVAHAGWRGTVAGAGVSVVRQMAETYGCRPQDIQAGIGPSIGPDRYQVGPEVVAAVRAAFSEADDLVSVAEDGTTTLNLWEANRRALQDAGLSQIEVAGICTASHTDEFFSHRAEAGRTGRFGAMIVLRA